MSRRAFPIIKVATYQDGTYATHDDKGMTLREYAAVAAMEGICAAMSGGYIPVDDCVKEAVQRADALIAALARKEGE